jgi:hypothetical protein
MHEKPQPSVYTYPLVCSKRYINSQLYFLVNKIIAAVAQTWTCYWRRTSSIVFICIIQIRKLATRAINHILGDSVNKLRALSIHVYLFMYRHTCIYLLLFLLHPSCNIFSARRILRPAKNSAKSDCCMCVCVYKYMRLERGSTLEFLSLGTCVRESLFSISQAIGLWIIIFCPNRLSGRGRRIEYNSRNKRRTHCYKRQRATPYIKIRNLHSRGRRALHLALQPSVCIWAFITARRTAINLCAAAASTIWPN